jgi:hypothetical protein
MLCRDRCVAGRVVTCVRRKNGDPFPLFKREPISIHRAALL